MTKAEKIIKEVNTEKLFEHWFKQLQLIEDKFLKSRDPELSFQIIYLLFPLIESISFSLFSKQPRYYLKKLEISHPDLVWKMFRNGHLHNFSPYKLEYKNGNISWGISSSSSSVVTKYNPGYKNDAYPEGNIEPEKEFHYTIFKNGEALASLSLDRLFAHIKYDLEKRKKTEKRKKLKIIVGQKINEDRPNLK
jgi:hypothetical protein